MSQLVKEYKSVAKIEMDGRRLATSDDYKDELLRALATVALHQVAPKAAQQNIRVQGKPTRRVFATADAPAGTVLCVPVGKVQVLNGEPTSSTIRLTFSDDSSDGQIVRPLNVIKIDTKTLQSAFYHVHPTEEKKDANVKYADVNTQAI